MNINRNNYEAILIDYLEGTLTPSEVSEVLLFLEQHPDIKAELDGLVMPLEAEEHLYPNHKDLLKPTAQEVRKQVTPLLVAQLEQTLSADEETTLAHTLKVYPELQRDQQLFALTKNEPDLYITFPDKQLLRKQRVFVLNTRWARAAAAVILTGGMVFGVLKYTPQQGAQTATNDSLNKLSPKVTTGTQTQVAESTGVNPAKNNVAETTPKAQTYTQYIGEQNNAAPIARASMASVQLVTKQAPLTLFYSIAAEKPQLSAAPSLVKKPYQETPAHLNQEFEEIGKLAMRKLKDNTQEVFAGIENYKKLDMVEAINKATGANVHVEKDTTSGRIQRLEIAALGLAWSRNR